MKFLLLIMMVALAGCAARYEFCIEGDCAKVHSPRSFESFHLTKGDLVIDFVGVTNPASAMAETVAQNGKLLDLLAEQRAPEPTAAERLAQANGVQWDRKKQTVELVGWAENGPVFMVRDR